MKLTDILKVDNAGLVCAVVQHARTGQVLMVGYMNAESLARTIEEQRVWFWSRSRQKLWLKGETSGHVLHLRECRVDCDGDTLLLKCEPAGPTCHTGETSCFYRVVDAGGTVTVAGDNVATT